MNELEAKRKELETAKRILKDGNCMSVDCEDCPFGCSLDSPYYNLDVRLTGFVNAFISGREAELAGIDFARLRAESIIGPKGEKLDGDEWERAVAAVERELG